MIAGPEEDAETMLKALARSLAALDAAVEIDPDRTPEDKAFFAAEKAKIEAHDTALTVAQASLTAHERGQAVVQQVRVELGDVVLDRGVRAANQKTKGGLSGKAGLPSSHVFGTRIDDLTQEPLRLEPGKVLEAVGRLADVAAFDGKDAIAADLSARAERQNTSLKDRDAAGLVGARLKNTLRVTIASAALALASLKGALDARFPRQRDYVATFFLDVAPRKRRGGGGATGGDGGQG